MDLSRDFPPPPSVPENLETGPPDFVGIGAQKSATSFWFNLILQHPRIYAAAHLEGQVQPAFLRKERHFFDRFFSKQVAEEDRDEFKRWFPRPRGMLAGEWTPRYSIEHWAPPLLKELAPDVKLLLILRDPVERFISGMNHRLRKAELTANDAHMNYLRGMYALQLSTWRRYFDPDRFLILQFERCIRDVIRDLIRTFDFLGVERFIPADAKLLSKPRNVTKERLFTLSKQHRQALVEAYLDDVAKLGELVDEFDPLLWSNFRNEVG